MFLAVLFAASISDMSRPLAILGSLFLAWTAAADAPRAVHDALFASYIPIEEVKDKPELTAMFTRVRDQIWMAAEKAPAFQALLTPFTDLRKFGDACGMPEFLTTTGVTSFAQLTPPQRAHALYLLHTCPANDPRRLAMNLRNFYLSKTYGPLQEPLTGVKLNLYATESYIAGHRPKLPPTRLRYDSAAREIALKNGEIDYLVVGAGPAGSVLAHELRRGGNHVVLVERGSFTVPGAMETRLIDELKESNGTRTSADGSIFIKNGMAVGGGSLVNVDLCFAPTLPTVQFKIDQWRSTGRIGVDDFTKADLAKAYEWVKTAIGTRALSESEINANNHKLWDGALLSKLHPKLYDLNTYPPGKSPYPVTDKRSASTELVLKALMDVGNPLSMLPDAEVRRVLFDEGTWNVRGVEVMMRPTVSGSAILADPNSLGLRVGELVTIRTRHVILSAGALGSPAILLRSRVPNDQIGRGAVVHASMPVLGRFDQTVDALSGTQASVFVDDFLISRGYAIESMSAEPLYAAIMAMGPAKYSLDMIMSFRNLAGFGVMLIDTPSPSNRVVLNGTGEPEVEYTLSDADKVRFRRGVAQAVRIMFRAGAKQVFLPTNEDILSGNTTGQLRPLVLTESRQADAVERNLRFIPNRSIVTSAHLQATNKLGASARDSVVSTDLKVWGTEGLYVVDGSIFPTSIGANPMQSIYTFAKIFADRQIH
jgi:choline dehydrogenase-like flavoprotein